MYFLLAEFLHKFLKKYILAIDFKNTFFPQVLNMELKFSKNCFDFTFC
jgi:hypothetical protein